MSGAVISEPFDNTNYDLAVSWEFRYTFYDDFGVQTYKSVEHYQKLARNAGAMASTDSKRPAATASATAVRIRASYTSFGHGDGIGTTTSGRPAANACASSTSTRCSRWAPVEISTPFQIRS